MGERRAAEGGDVGEADLARESAGDGVLYYRDDGIGGLVLRGDHPGSSWWQIADGRCPACVATNDFRFRERLPSPAILEIRPSGATELVEELLAELGARGRQQQIAVGCAARISTVAGEVGFDPLDPHRPVTEMAQVGGKGQVGNCAMPDTSRSNRCVIVEEDALIGDHTMD